MVMMMPPYHGALLKGTPDQTFEQFTKVGEVGIPIMIQDAPLSGVELSVPLLVRMAREIEMVKLFKIECPQAANKLRALIGAFAGANPIAFHREDGAGYRLTGEVIERLQASNPQIAARMLAPMTRWRRYAVGQEAMRGELERLAAIDPLPKDVFEVVTKALEEPS